MPDLPTGTVTLLFTDIEGSTRLLAELGPETYGTALARHRQVLREAFAAQGGVEVDTQGDAFFVAFADARAALAAAATAQRALSDGPIRVRMGLHTGTPHLTAEGYVGEDVHLGARICAAGHGGQILISKATRETVDGDMSDLGEHRLKDFGAPVWIYQLGADRFPPLKTISNTNLPSAASSFVGREREVTEIAALLSGDARLVTLTGPGGTGKTRLAIESAATVIPQFRNGVFWVGLASLRDPSLVQDTIAQTLGTREGLPDHIGGREMLLLLDNLEQVIEAAPELAALVEACPNLRVLVTSRELLRVRGETEYRVPPLAEREAIDLFCVRSQLAPTDAIAELCRRLDNLPLAVELAAARASVLAPAQILARLTQRLDLLKGGRDADPRQQTLRTTIEWSHDLLSDDEKQLFGRLAVFAGGCTLEAAEDVVGADVDTLQSLVDKSLVRHTEERFWMLETIGEFAHETLMESGDTERLRLAHAQHYLALALEAEKHLHLFSAEWIDRLESDNDNLRAALDTLTGAGDSRTALRLAGALTDYWMYGRHVSEGARRIESALAADAEASPARLKALLGAADLAGALNDLELAEARATEGLELSRGLHDDWSLGYAMNVLAAILVEKGDYDLAELHQKTAVELFRTLGDEEFAIAGTRTLGWILHGRGDLAGARELHEENLEHARRIGFKETEIDTLGSLSMIALAGGELDRAAALARENVVAAREFRSAIHMAQSLGRAADVLATSHRSPTVAARLLGCFDALAGEIGFTEPWVARANEETWAKLRQQLDEEALRRAMEDGRKLSLNEAIAVALEVLS